MSLLKSKNKTFMKEFNQIFEIINFTQKILGDNYPKIIQQIFKKSYDIEKVLVSGSRSGSRSRSGSGSGSGSRSRSGSGSRTIKKQRGGKHGRAAAYHEDKSGETYLLITIFVAVYWFFSRMMYNKFEYVGGNVDPGGMG